MVELRNPFGPEQSKEWVQFYKHLEQNIASDPNAYRQQAAELLGKKDASRSKLLLECHIHSNQEDVEALVLLAKTCLQLQCGLDEALVAARKSCTMEAPHQLRNAAVNVLAVALGRKARNPRLSGVTKTACRQEAISVLEAALGSISAASGSAASGSGSSAATANYNLSVLHAEAGDAGKAVEHAKAALQASAGGTAPELHMLSLVMLALLLSARNETHAALSVLAAVQDKNQAPSLSSAPTPTTSVLPQAELIVARVRAQLLLSLDDAAAAMAVMAKAKKHLSALPDAGKQEGKAWLELALGFGTQGALADAFFCTDQAQRLMPWHPNTHHVLGCVLEAAGRAEEAANSYNTALALDPCHAPSLLRLGTIHRRSGGVSQAAVARDLLTEALRYDPSLAEGWYQLGLACKAMHHRPDAEQHLHTAVLLAASSPALPFSTMPLLLV